jgi:VWFA-related protein
MKRATLCRIVLALLSLNASAPFVGAQNPVPSGSTSEQKSIQTTFKSQATLVEVPAVVTDKDGKHIHGLNKSDFRVLENGKEQKIAFFEEVTASNSRLPLTNNPADTFTNLTVNTAERHAVTVVLLDEINTPYLDQVYGREQLIKYLAENLNSHQTIALMLLGRKGVTRVSNFTDDPSSVINALKKIRSELPAGQGPSIDGPELASIRSGAGSGPVQFRSPQSESERLLREFLVAGNGLDARFGRERPIEDTMQAFLSIAWSLSGVPGRKSLIWATGSFPFYLDSPSFRPPDPRLAALYERAMEALNDAQISVYPVDVRGLVGYAGPSEAANTNWVRRPGMGGPAFAAASMAQSERQYSTIANMETFASMTGGHAFFNRNDLTTGFRQAAEDSASYYVLGYYLNSQNTKPGWRKLRVKLEGRHSEVRAREGFFVGTSTMDAESAHQADVNFALTSPFESTGIPMMVRWNSATASTEKGAKSEFAIVVPAGSVVKESDDNRFDLEFVWEADRDGAPAWRDGKTMKGSTDSQSLARIRREGVIYKNFLQLTPGEYKIHFVVRNNLNGRIGSVTAPLTVN